MKYLKPLAIALAAACCLNADVNSNPFTISGRPADDQAAISKWNFLDVKDILAPDSIWVVAKVSLDPGSYTPTSHFEPEFGKPGAKLITITYVKGTCEILAKLNGDLGKDKWDFNWDNPTVNRGGSIGRNAPRPPLGPLIHDGIAIIHLVPAAPRDKLFAASYQLPDKSWTAFTSEWVATHRKQPELFAPENAAQNKDKLSAFCQGNNPLLSLDACRTLLSLAAPPTDALQTALKKSPWLTQALITQALLQHTTKENTESLYKMLDPIIAAAKDAATIEGIAAGATFAPALPQPGKDLANRLLKTISAKLPSLKGDAEIKACIRRLVEIHDLSTTFSK